MTVLKEEQAPIQTAGCLFGEKAVAPLALTHAIWIHQGAISAIPPAGASKALLSTNAFHILLTLFRNKTGRKIVLPDTGNSVRAQQNVLSSYICIRSLNLMLRMAVLWLRRGWMRCPPRSEPLPLQNYCPNGSQARVSTGTKPALMMCQLTVLVFLTISLIIG